MSYPRKLHALVVEDDADVIESYRSTFKQFREQGGFPLVEPVYVTSFADAKNLIDEQRVFHLVVLDLNLPMEARREAEEGTSVGEQLLEMLAKRDAFPVPAVVVVSGKLNQSSSIGGLTDKLANAFMHGRLANKGSNERHEIEAALAAALRYVDVGVHIRDAGREWFPTLSPREDDLLRRCVVQQRATLGVDVSWWSAEAGPSSSSGLSPYTGPTKVLMGHFLLDDVGQSRPTFFKFEPVGNAAPVARDASILAQKLSHVKVIDTRSSGLRSLIVTQSVTDGGPPISLDAYLQREPALVRDHIPGLVDEVTKQLAQLGRSSDEERPVRTLLFEHLRRDAIAKVLATPENRSASEDTHDPLVEMDALLRSTQTYWTRCRECTHGDLNSTNIAVDAHDPGHPRAYIFDSGGMRRDFDFRDLATLEVTTTLFHSGSDQVESFGVFRGLYPAEFLPQCDQGEPMSPFATNVFEMVTALRRYAASERHEETYALLVFDAVLRQLSGLGIQPSPNKVRSPRLACDLARWVATWLRGVSSATHAAAAATADVVTQARHEVAPR